jgi:hypothetical protein
VCDALHCVLPTLTCIITCIIQVLLLSTCTIDILSQELVLLIINNDYWIKVEQWWLIYDVEFLVMLEYSDSSSSIYSIRYCYFDVGLTVEVFSTFFKAVAAGLSVPVVKFAVGVIRKKVCTVLKTSASSCKEISSRPIKLLNNF